MINPKSPATAVWASSVSVAGCVCGYAQLRIGKRGIAKRFLFDRERSHSDELVRRCSLKPGKER
jgi:hypothetical protein